MATIQILSPVALGPSDARTVVPPLATLAGKRLGIRVDRAWQSFHWVADEVARKMDGLTIVLHKKAGEEDVLYGSVTPSEIADALAGRGVEVDRRRVELAEPIKRLGQHTVHVRLHRDVVATLTIDVQPIAPATQ